MKGSIVIFFENEIKKRKIKPTRFLPLWDLLGVGLGFGTTLLGKKAPSRNGIPIQKPMIQNKKCIILNKYVRSLTRKIGGEEIISSLSNLGLLNKNIFEDKEKINVISNFLNRFNPENKYWEINLNSSEKSILFENTYRSVTEKFELKSEDLNYHEVLEINNLY